MQRSYFTDSVFHSQSSRSATMSTLFDLAAGIGGSKATLTYGNTIISVTIVREDVVQKEEKDDIEPQSVVASEEHGKKTKKNHESANTEDDDADASRVWGFVFGCQAMIGRADKFSHCCDIACIEQLVAADLRRLTTDSTLDLSIPGLIPHAEHGECGVHEVEDSVWDRTRRRVCVRGGQSDTCPIWDRLEDLSDNRYWGFD